MLYPRPRRGPFASRNEEGSVPTFSPNPLFSGSCKIELLCKSTCYYTRHREMDALDKSWALEKTVRRSEERSGPVLVVKEVTEDNNMNINLSAQLSLAHTRRECKLKEPGYKALAFFCSSSSAAWGQHCNQSVNMFKISSESTTL